MLKKSIKAFFHLTSIIHQYWVPQHYAALCYFERGLGISDFVTVTPKSKIFQKILKYLPFFLCEKWQKIAIFVNILLWKLKALCNKGVWGVSICYGASHIEVWGLKTAILGVT